MKLLKDNGTILEIYAGEINETQVNNKTGWGNKTIIEIKLISDQVEFRKPSAYGNIDFSLIQTILIMVFVPPVLALVSALSLGE